MLIYLDPIFQAHDTGIHPENAARISPLIQKYGRATPGVQHVSWGPVSRERLLRLHGPAYIDAVKAFAEGGGGQIECDTVVCPQSYRVALMAAGAVCDAVEQVVRGDTSRAFCIVRPPGHHALPDAPMGFCLFNNVATGARIAIAELALERVLIVDWDVHHGNGTQAMFWDDPQVGFFSIHRYPFYPGTGAADEKGEGPGRGATFNLPVPYGTSRADYLAMFSAALEGFADAIKPQLVMISAGFDSHRDDPVGSLGLESVDFADLTRVVLAIAKTHAEGRVVSVLEGGYNPAALAESVEQHLQVLGD